MRNKQEGTLYAMGTSISTNEPGIIAKIHDGLKYLRILPFAFPIGTKYSESEEKRITILLKEVTTSIQKLVIFYRFRPF